MVTERAVCILAPNPSAMTLDGTNTWLLGEPGASSGVVVDPGPLDPEHLNAVADQAHRRGLGIEVILLTHHHADHEEGAARFADMTGARVLGGSFGGVDADTVIDVDGLSIEVLATPGHTRDSLSFLLRQDRSLLTGDTVLGRGTTVVAWPDGELRAYLASLDTLQKAVAEAAVERLLPAHGPTIDDPAAVLTQYQRHRAQRLEQVRAALAEGAHDAADVVAVVYADVPESVKDAAKRSVQAQLDYLRS